MTPLSPARARVRVRDGSVRPLQAHRLEALAVGHEPPGGQHLLVLRLVAALVLGHALEAALPHPPIERLVELEVLGLLPVEDVDVVDQARMAHRVELGLGPPHHLDEEGLDVGRHEALGVDRQGQLGVV